MIFLVGQGLFCVFMIIRFYFNGNKSQWECYIEQLAYLGGDKNELINVWYRFVI